MTLIDYKWGFHFKLNAFHTSFIFKWKQSNHNHLIFIFSLFFRHLVESGRSSAFHSKSPKSAGPGDIFPLRLSTPTSISAAVDLSSTNGSHTAPNSPIVTAFGPLNSSLSLTPSSATSANNQTFTHFPVPPPLIPVPPGSGNAVAAVAMAAMANAFNSSKSKAASVASSSSGKIDFSWHFPLLTLVQYLKYNRAILLKNEYWNCYVM